MRTPQLGFSAVAKPSGAACNLDCSYCFFRSKEVLYEARSQSMSEQTLAAYLSAYLRAAPDGEVVVGWQGGGPTMRGLPFFRRAVELAERLRRPGQRLVHAIQTNGTLLDDAWGEFLAAHHFVVGISIDGPAKLHDSYRVNHAGHGSHRKVMRGYDVLCRHQVDTSVLCTVHAANADHPLEVYRYLRDELEADYLQFIPIVERATAGRIAAAERGWRNEQGQRVLAVQAGDRVTSRSVAPPAWGAFLIAVFDDWAAHDVERVSVQHFDAMLGNRAGRYELCVHAPTCGRLPAVTHTGDVYACDHYVEPAHLLGNVHNDDFAEMLTSPQQRRFGAAKRGDLTVQCRRCPVLWACHGGCPKDRFDVSSDGEPGQNYLCAGYRSFLEHAAPTVEHMYARLSRNLPWTPYWHVPDKEHDTDEGGCQHQTCWSERRGIRHTSRAQSHQ